MVFIITVLITVWYLIGLSTSVYWLVWLEGEDLLVKNIFPILVISLFGVGLFIVMLFHQVNGKKVLIKGRKRK